MAGKYNINLDLGATYLLDLTWKDDAGTPIDLTGYLADFQIRKVASAPTPVVAISESESPMGVIGLGGSSGIIAIRVNADATDNIEPGRYVYGLKLQAGPTGEETLLLEGNANLNPSVVR